jgi:hypothetical protein
MMKLSWKKKGNAMSTKPTLTDVCIDSKISMGEDLEGVRSPERRKCASSPHVSSPTSLGSGHYSPSDGTVVEFFPPSSDELELPLLADVEEPSKPASLKIVESTMTDTTTESTDTNEEVKEQEEAFLSAPPVVSFLRDSSSFLRVADLFMDPDMDLSSHGTESIPHYHCSSVDPPPGIPHDPLEKWVALGGDGEDATPIAPWAVHCLTQTGLATLLDENMWVPDSKTSAILHTKSVESWERSTFASSHLNSARRDEASSESDHVLIWSGSFRHGLYGSDLPAIRSAAVIPMRPQELFDLLVDSGRVREYNSMSLGRTDLWTLPGGHGDSNDDDPTIVTKIMRSESRPPLLRKILQFTSIFHARHYEDGYLLVTRAVEHPSTKKTSSVVVSEILLGVNVIRPYMTNSCILLTVNHIRSPMVPMYIAKRLGLQAAVNFVHDLRRCA